MKTYVLRLDRHDDYISIRDRMSWSKTPRILLAFPRRKPPLLDSVDLAILQKHAHELGSQIGIVTRDRDLSESAEDLGIPAFSSIPAAQRLSWSRSKRRRLVLKKRYKRHTAEELRERLNSTLPGAERLWVRITAFTLGILAVLSLVALFLPSAQIILHPKSEIQTLALKVWASPDIPSGLSTGGLPASVVTTVVEGQLESSNLETSQIPNRASTGKVQVTNLTEQMVEISAGTVFVTSTEPQIRFESIRDETVPAGVGSQISLDVRAQQPGIQGNVPPATVNAIEGPVGLLVVVTNPEEMQGGSNRTGRISTEQEYDRLYDALITSLAESALSQISAQTPEEDWILPDSLQRSEILEIRQNPPPGTPTDKITLFLRVEYEAWVVQKVNLQTLSRTALDATLPLNWEAADDDLYLVPLSEPQPDEDGVMQWEVLASRNIQPVFNEMEIQGLVSGKSTTEAIQILERQYNLTATPSVNLNPSWWKWLPFLSFRIGVNSQ